LVVTALLALAASWAAGWAVAFHLASDDHGGRATSDGGGALGLQMAVHGHVHAEGTPEHGHPVVGSAPVPIRARLSLLAPVMTGDAPEVVLTAASSRWLASPSAANHDPPPRSIFVLRI